ncbi:hypothetical protein [Neobacillus sp.]|uniref:hypothetical protein n=1 Tax=Neobacillus sp. TaxID=2675273 RepID=UPI0035B54C4B
MKKRWIILMLMVVSIFMLMGCSSKEKKSAAEIKVTKENASYLEQYDKNLQGFLKEMTSILKTFNNALDGLYTKQYSKEQFSSLITGTIEKSNKLVSEVEALDVDPELFEAHQNLILLVNTSHQLLLDAVDMANNEDGEIEKEELRTKLLEIKTSQAETTNQWKILRKELSENAGKK